MGDSSQATYSAHLPIGAGGPHSAVTAEHQPSARASAGWVTGSQGALIRQSGSPFPEIPGETGTEQRSTVTPGAYVVAVAVAACGMTHGPAGLRAPAPDLDWPESRRRPEAHAERHEGGAQNPREDGRNGRGDRRSAETPTCGSASAWPARVAQTCGQTRVWMTWRRCVQTRVPVRSIGQLRGKQTARPDGGAPRPVGGAA